MPKPKTRNAKTMTESAYWSMIRSALRSATRYWKPMQAAKTEARRKYIGDNHRQKWEYQCNSCKLWHMGKNIQIDHVTPLGSLRCLEDLADFVNKLTPEYQGAYQVLCKPCHQKKTNHERERTRKAFINM
jgi:hypothetical protein